MNAGEAEVVDYIDTLLDEAPAATPSAPAVGPAHAPAPAANADAPARSEAPATPAPPAAPPASLEPVATAAPSAAAPVPLAAVPARTPPPVQAEPPAPLQMSQAPRWLRVVVGGASYALELLRVQEVVRLMPIVPMRGAQPAVLGVMNLRGRIVPVFDLGLWLGTGRVDADDQSRIVVVERDDELIGLLVSAVEDVVTLGRDRIEPPLPGDGRGVVLGVARVGAVPTVLFDAYALYG